MPTTHTQIKIVIEGGMIQSIVNIPEGVSVVVLDKDCEAIGENGLSEYESDGPGVPMTLHDHMEKERVIGILWSVEDITDRWPLSEDQAWEVLQTIERQASSEYGITWDTLYHTVMELHPGIEPLED